MDVIIRNGDTVPAGSGDLAKAQGVEALFQRGEILMNMSRGRFYLRPEMGSRLGAGDLSDPEKTELILNEALAPVEGLTARVLGIDGPTVNVRLFCGKHTKDCEVMLNEHI